MQIESKTPETSKREGRNEIPYEWLKTHNMFNDALDELDEYTFFRFLNKVRVVYPSLISIDTKGIVSLKIDKINEDLKLISKRETTHLNQMIIQIDTFKKLLELLNQLKNTKQQHSSIPINE